MQNLHFSWRKVEALPDPQHGMPRPRSSHGVSMLLASDSLILYGGENIARTPIEVEVASCWVCKGVSSTQPFWNKIDCHATGNPKNFPPSRIAHAQAVYNDKHIYIFGGRAGITMKEQAMNDLWMLDTETFTWTEVDVSSEAHSVPEARSFHRMVCLGTSLYVFGGCGATSGRLNDLHKFDIINRTWHTLGASAHLRGRGGPNLIKLQAGKQLAVVAGFAGEETADGHVFDVAPETWAETSLTAQLEGLRPRSVCVSASFPSLCVAVIFGGEVDPSEKGHEGAGGFANDVIILNESSGKFLDSIPDRSNGADLPSWPEARGWSDAAATTDALSGVGHMFVFGGLAGDDTNPKRLNDFWRLDIRKDS